MLAMSLQPINLDYKFKFVFTEKGWLFLYKTHTYT